MEVNEAKSPLEGEIRDLLNQIKLADKEKELLEKTLNDSHQVELKSKQEIIDLKDDEIARIKEMKLKMSVKEIGEKSNLESIDLVNLFVSIEKNLKEDKNYNLPFDEIIQNAERFKTIGSLRAFLDKRFKNEKK